MSKPIADLRDRFWSKVDWSDSEGCWPWLAGKNAEGYGMFALGPKKFKKNIGAHRMAYELSFGSPRGREDGLRVVIRHTCHNPGCVSPFHLLPGTDQDNTDDRERAGRNKLPMINGERHANSKLTDAQAEEIKKSPLRGKDLAKIFNVSQSVVSMIRHGRAWIKVTKDTNSCQ